jgi:hypothetical protein
MRLLAPSLLFLALPLVVLAMVLAIIVSNWISRIITSRRSPDDSPPRSVADCSRRPALVHESGELHVLPAGALWQASCSETGLTALMGGFWQQITDIALGDRQCAELLSIVGQAMLRLTDRPAPQPRVPEQKQ